jgi:hypothetical protein
MGLLKTVHNLYSPSFTLKANLTGEKAQWANLWLSMVA